MTAFNKSSHRVDGPSRLWPSCTAIVVGGLAAYANSFAGVFLFDDLPHLVLSARLHQLWPPGALFGGSTRPLVDLTLALNYALGGLHVWGYHAINLTIHLAAGLTLFGLLRRTLLTERLAARFAPAATGLAFSSALLWVVHPLQTQSVTYIIQRAESLMGFCYLLTVYAVLRSATTAHPRRWILLAILACAAGMASKAVMVTAPLLVLLYDRTFLAGSVRAALRQRAYLYLGLAAGWGVLGGLFLIAHQPLGASAGLTVENLSPIQYAVTQPGSILHYLKLSLWPHPLVLDYFGTMERIRDIHVVHLLFVGGLVAAMFWAVWRRRMSGFLAGCFFLILAPTSSVFPLVDITVEHRMYLPLAAVVTLAVICGWVVLGRCIPSTVLRQRVASMLVMALLILFGALTLRRNEDYRSDVGMWRDVVEKQPMNFRAHDGIGEALLREGANEAAVPHFQEAIRIEPRYPEPYLNLGVVETRRGNFEEAIELFQQAIRLRPHFQVAHNNLGRLLFQQGRLDEAIAHYREAIRYTPDLVEAHFNLGVALAEQGKLNEAAASLARAVRLRPEFSEAHHNLGAVRAKQGNFEAAMTHLSEAVRLAPDDEEAHRNLEHARHLHAQTVGARYDPR